ncbi:uncharacterized protein [Misgurnus anguillicaudatus]|uniref:uncharacterized protein n=1 Tax=Misgurnus anguillicaudatus TaxID=75329 RepID=UPI003CCF6180
MKKIYLLFFIFLFINGVFGDEVKSVSVMEGDSVTLHTDITEIKADDVINWRFDGVRIAQINKAASIMSLDDDVLDGRFKARLYLNSQTGDLTITNITTKDSGLYKLQISDSSKSIEKIFNVTGVFGDEMKSVSVMAGDSVTLHTDVLDIQKYDVIRWRFQHENSPLAELNRKTALFSTYDNVNDGRFKGRLQLNVQTGSLTITNIRTDHSGLYEVDISNSSTHTIHQSFTVTVYGGVKTVSVMEGNSVTLYTDTEIQTYGLTEWMFGDGHTPIAQMYKPKTRFAKYDGDDERFKNRLRLNDQTGDLTITHIRTEHTGVYEVKISSNRHSFHRRFIVTVTALGLSLGAVAGICFTFLFIAAVTVVVIYYRLRFHWKDKCWDKNQHQLIQQEENNKLYFDQVELMV